MTEKQRWLLRELDEWKAEQMQRIGQYGPTGPRTSPALLAAHRAVKRAEEEVERQNKKIRQPWETARDRIAKQHQAVKRSILFEKTEVALRAIRALK